MSDPISNPIGYLQEFCMKSGNAAFPKYTELLNYNGPGKRFTFQCSYDGYKQTGCGTTKKQAKYNAAKNMYLLLQAKDYFTNYNLPRQSNQAQDIRNNSQDVTSNPGNFKEKSPISILQDFCLSENHAMPNYTERSLCSFNCECIVLDNKTFGNGPSIKSAKTEAAGKMCIALKLLDDWDFEAIVQPPRQEISGEGIDTTKKGAKVLAAQKVLVQLNQQTVSVNSDSKEKIPKDEDNAKVNKKSAVKLHPDITPILEEFSLTSDDEDQCPVNKKVVSILK